MRTAKYLLGAAGALVLAYWFFPPFRYWVAVNFLPAGTAKGKTGSTLKVV